MKIIMIAGSGRSGTTWVLDALAEAADLKMVFEPLHAVVGDCSKRYANRYLPAEQEDEELKSFMRKVLSGNLKSLWTDYRTLADRLKPGVSTFYSPRQFVAMCRMYKKLWGNYLRYRKTRYAGIAVKFIRANLLLEWILFNFDVAVLCVVRHPCAVIESKMRLDTAATNAGLRKGASDWDPAVLMSRYLEDEVLCERYIAPYLGDMRIKDYSATELHAIIWSVENGEWLKGEHLDSVVVTAYEKLAGSDKNEWQRIIGELGLDQSVLKRLELDAPSEQASQDYLNSEFESSHSARWMARMDSHDKDAISRILDAFHIAAYAVNDPLPKCEL